MSQINLITVLGAVAMLVTAASPIPAQRPTSMAGRSTVYASNGVIATSQPLASAAAVLSVAEPHMTGIGRRHVRDRLARERSDSLPHNRHLRSSTSTA